MLQDAVWVNAEWIGQEGNEDIATRFLKASFRGWIHCLDNFDECVNVVLDAGSTLGESHQQWQLNEVLALIFPATNGIGVMNQALWDQTVTVATGQIPELQGASIDAGAFRTDLAQAAVDALAGGASTTSKDCPTHVATSNCDRAANSSAIPDDGGWRGRANATRLAP